MQAKKHGTKLDPKVIELRDERALFAGCLIVARSRPEIDVKEALGEYEFSSFPRSLFSSDGKLLPTRDKSKLMAALETLAGEGDCQYQADQDEPLHPTQHEPHDDKERAKRCAVIDGMTIVQEMAKPQ